MHDLGFKPTIPMAKNIMCLFKDHMKCLEDKTNCNQMFILHFKIWWSINIRKYWKYCQRANFPWHPTFWVVLCYKYPTSCCIRLVYIWISIFKKKSRYILASLK
jgi:hypothetical protein